MFGWVDSITMNASLSSEENEILGAHVKSQPAASVVTHISASDGFQL